MAANIARPYVDALFAVAPAGKAEALVPVLTSFARTLDGSPALQGFFRNPAVPRDRKEAALAALAAQAGIEGLALRLLGVLLANRRILRTGEVVRAIRQRLDRQQNMIAARLATAAPLADADAERIRGALEGRTGRTVRLTRDVDPGLLGGFVVRIGSEIYDASLAQRLRKTRQALHGGAEGQHG